MQKAIKGKTRKIKYTLQAKARPIIEKAVEATGSTLLGEEYHFDSKHAEPEVVPDFLIRLKNNMLLDVEIDSTSMHRSSRDYARDRKLLKERNISTTRLNEFDLKAENKAFDKLVSDIQQMIKTGRPLPIAENRSRKVKINARNRELSSYGLMIYPWGNGRKYSVSFRIYPEEIRPRKLLYKEPAFEATKVYCFDKPRKTSDVIFLSICDFGEQLSKNEETNLNVYAYSRDLDLYNRLQRSTNPVWQFANEVLQKHNLIYFYALSAHKINGTDYDVIENNARVSGIDKMRSLRAEAKMTFDSFMANRDKDEEERIAKRTKELIESIQCVRFLQTGKAIKFEDDLS